MQIFIFCIYKKIEFISFLVVFCELNLVILILLLCEVDILKLLVFVCILNIDKISFIVEQESVVLGIVVMEFFYYQQQVCICYMVCCFVCFNGNCGQLRRIFLRGGIWQFLYFLVFDSSELQLQIGGSICMEQFLELYIFGWF